MCDSLKRGRSIVLLGKAEAPEENMECLVELYCKDLNIAKSKEDDSCNLRSRFPQSLIDSHRLEL